MQLTLPPDTFLVGNDSGRFKETPTGEKPTFIPPTQ